MNRHKIRCQWCPQLYTLPRAYSNHLAKFHPEKNLSLEKPKSRKCRLSDLSNSDSSPSEFEIANIAEFFLEKCNSSDSELESEGSDKEAQDYSSDSESHEESQQSDTAIAITQLVAGIPIRAHCFPERDSEFNLYSPFRHAIDYRLAHFFNAVQASEKKIN